MMRHRGTIRTAARRALVLLVGATAFAAVPSSSHAQTIHACYVPVVGLIYRIKKPGLPQACVIGGAAFEFSWDSAGVAGPVGPAGVAGSAGAAGPVGPAGAAGPTGPTGNAGAANTITGPAGIAGPVGPNGSAGPAGAAGAQGPPGATGVVGPTGFRGDTGRSPFTGIIAEGANSPTITNANPPATTSLTVSCPAGQTAIGGSTGFASGVFFGNNPQPYILASRPTADGTGWFGTLGMQTKPRTDGGDNSVIALRVVVICAFVH